MKYLILSLTIISSLITNLKADEVYERQDLLEEGIGYIVVKGINTSQKIKLFNILFNPDSSNEEKADALNQLLEHGAIDFVVLP